MDERARLSPGRILISLSAMAIVLLVLSACGTGGDDENPTEAAETVEAPTEEPVTDLTGEQVDAASSPTERVIAVATPEPGSGSPTPSIVVSAPPIVVATAMPTQPGTVAPPQVAASPEAVADSPTATVAAGAGAGGAIGDGTGGAPAGASQPETPDGAGTPASGGEADAIATSCDVASFPPYSGDSPTQVTVSDVNFRAGPGVDCDAIDGPLAGGVAVQLLSDPITREGDDQYQWVLVSIDGTEGWLATEFLEPAPA